MKAINWAIEVRGLDPGPWRLLVVLASHVGKRGYDVWPSLNRMAEKAEISRPSAKRYLAELVAMRLVEKVDTLWRENGGRSVNVYRLLVGEIDTSDVGPDEEDEYVSLGDPRVSLNRGPGQSYDSPPRVTAEPCREPLKERTSKEEDSPLSFGEDTPTQKSESFQLALTSPDPRSVDLIDYIAAEWKKLAAEYKLIPAVRAWTTSRTETIKRRTKEYLDKSGERISAHDVWSRIFAAIRNDEWLRGDAPPGRGYSKPFAVDVDHLLRVNQIAVILEKDEINAQRNRETHSADGRRYGPAEQAGRKVLARMGLDQEP